MSETKDYYRIRFKNKQLIHAVTTKHAPMGDYLFDQHFGGGFEILCGLDSDDEATLYEPQKAPKIKTTCNKCLKAIKASN